VEIHFADSIISGNSKYSSALEGGKNTYPVIPNIKKSNTRPESKQNAKSKRFLLTTPGIAKMRIGTRKAMRNGRSKASSGVMKTGESGTAPCPKPHAEGPKYHIGNNEMAADAPKTRSVR